LGEGIATHRVPTALVRSLRVGLRAIPTAVAVFGGDLKLLWNISSSSRSVCRIVAGQVRFLGAGTCKVALRTFAGTDPVLRSIRVSR
jgi:hypothetical protein